MHAMIESMEELGTNGKVEDMVGRDGEEMPAGEHEEDKDHGPWFQSGPSYFTN